MKVDSNCKVAVSYKLTVNGEVKDQAPSDRPLEFIFGVGQLLPGFESAVYGLTAGQEFSADLPPEKGYGTYDMNRRVDVPIEVFAVDGKVEHDYLQPGTAIPMQTTHGDTLLGRVVEVKKEHVLMDFNHELAGETLHFTGRVERVEELTPEQLDEFFASQDCCCCGHDHDHEDHCGCDEGGCACG